MRRSNEEEVFESLFIQHFTFQATTASHEELPVLPPADPPQRSDLPSLQGQVQVQEPEEAQEEGLRLVRVPVRSLGIKT